MRDNCQVFCLQYFNLASKTHKYGYLTIFLLHFLIQTAIAGSPPTEGSHVRVGSAPVTCTVIVGDQMWCGCGNNVVVLDAG